MLPLKKDSRLEVSVHVVHVQHSASKDKSTMKYIAVYNVTSEKDSRLEVSVHCKCTTFNQQL